MEIELDRNWISIIDFGGTDRDLSLLARYAGEPVLGRDLGSGVALERPMTRFLILTDAEHKYATVKDRNYQRKLLLDSLTQNVPPDLRCDYYSSQPESRIVEIRTWGRYPLEFAHFTDLQLAKAIIDSAAVPYAHGQGRLVRAIHMQRTNDPSPNVDDVFWRGNGLSKTKLADALWPMLEKKIRRAIDHKEPGPPIMRPCASPRDGRCALPSEHDAATESPQATITAGLGLSRLNSQLIAFHQYVPSVLRSMLANLAQRFREYLAAAADTHGVSLARPVTPSWSTPCTRS